jgi:hypothetical protein
VFKVGTKIVFVFTARTMGFDSLKARTSISTLKARTSVAQVEK